MSDADVNGETADVAQLLDALARLYKWHPTSVANVVTKVMHEQIRTRAVVLEGAAGNKPAITYEGLKALHTEMIQEQGDAPSPLVQDRTTE